MTIHAQKRHVRKTMSTREAAEFLNIDRKAIMKYIKQGKLKANLFGQRTYRILASDFNDFLEKTRFKAS